MKNIVFTIKTAYSTESYFLPIDENKSIYLQVETALANYCYCDDYELVDYKEVDAGYMEERKALIEKYNSICEETIEDAFCCGILATNESIKENMEWELNNK